MEILDSESPNLERAVPSAVGDQSLQALMLAVIVLAILVGLVLYFFLEFLEKILSTK